MPNHSITNPHWQPAETALVESILYAHPITQIIQILQTYQAQHKLYVRSPAGIRAKIRQLGREEKYQEDNFNQCQLARILDIPRGRVAYWCKRGLPHKCGDTPSTPVSIALKDFSRWATANPKYMYAIEPYRLEYATNDPNLATTAATILPYAPKVINKDTGQIFPNTCTAARSIGKHRDTLRRAIKDGRMCGGYRWDYCRNWRIDRMMSAY